LPQTVVFFRASNQPEPADPNSVTKRETRYATAFVVEWKGLLYLVTAKHAVEPPFIYGTYLFKLKTGKLDGRTLSQVRTLYPAAKWFVHRTRDVAVHPCMFPRNQVRATFILPRDFSIEPPQLLAPVAVVGFPLALGIARDTFTPIAKHAYVANPLVSIQVAGTDPATQYMLLDEPIATGFSGSPVFSLIQERGPEHLPSNTAKLIGIASGTRFDRRTAGNFGYVTPIESLLEIFDYPEFNIFHRLYEPKAP